MLKLAEKIGLPEKLCKSLSELDRGEIERLCDRCEEKGFDVLKKEDILMRLAVILLSGVRVKKKYDEAGISEKIYYDTMSDIRIWSSKTGFQGLEKYGWLKNHVSFELFRLGRLQFQFYQCSGRAVLYSKLPFERGERVIYIHIPEGEKLTPEACSESLEMAGEFFARYFPSYSYGYYFCESWLLFEGNRDFMAKDSNIVRFMDRFSICYSVKADFQAIERIFGKRELFKKRYPENTDLQRRAKAYMLSGKRLGAGVGVIKK